MGGSTSVRSARGDGTGGGGTRRRYYLLHGDDVADVLASGELRHPPEWPPLNSVKHPGLPPPATMAVAARHHRPPPWPSLPLPRQRPPTTTHQGWDLAPPDLDLALRLGLRSSSGVRWWSVEEGERRGLRRLQEVGRAGGASRW
jgi:hypothetical protein